MTVTHESESAPQDGCPCAVCHWARTGERSRVREESTADLTANYAAYQAGDLVGFDTFGYLAGPHERE